MHGMPMVSSLRPNLDSICHVRAQNELCSFAQALGKKRSAIKSVIMDQSVLAGVGNWVSKNRMLTLQLLLGVCTRSGRSLMCDVPCRWRTRSCTRQRYTLVSVPVI